MTCFLVTCLCVENVAKRTGVRKPAPARVLIAELVRRYWVLDMECSLLEIQKLAWFLERNIERADLRPPLDPCFVQHKFGLYAERLRHLPEGLDGITFTATNALPVPIRWM